MTQVILPTISINTLCLPDAPLFDHVACIRRLGVNAISPTIEDIAAMGAANAAQLLSDSGLTVATLTHRAFAYATDEEASKARTRLDATIAAAKAIGAHSITMTTGGRGSLDWHQAVENFATQIAPCVRTAQEAGVTLAIEPTSHLYADVSIAYRLSDTLHIAQTAGIGLGIDLFACWFDADIDQAIAVAAPHAALVQVSDYVAGDRALPCRAIPGDGRTGLDRLLPKIRDAGFAGFYDIEVIGPRIIAEGAESALRRAITYIVNMLERG